MQSIIFTALITAGLCLAGCVSYGQTFSEWWQQKKTRIKYLKQQAAVLEELKETMENGYAGAEEGTDTIETITLQEFTLHEKFLKSFRMTKSALKDNPDLVASRVLAVALLQRMQRVLQISDGDQGFTKSDIKWLKDYMADMIMGLRFDMEELDMLTSDEDFTMKDSERYSRIHLMAVDIQGIYRAAMAYLNQMEEILMLKQTQADDDFLRSDLN